MPLNVRRFSTSIFLVLVGFITAINAQVQAVNSPNPIPPAVIPIKTPTAAEIMRERISKAKAFIAVRNYNAAIYELENIRRETSDSSVHAVTNILLMNSYLEQGNYKKAQDLLAETYKNFKANNSNGSMFYSAVAGQAVKGARNQIERYRLLGLSVADRNLPLEAVNDIEKMRETIELVITQTKEAGADKATATVAMPLLEEAMATRSSLGRDDYDAKRWRDEGMDVREEIANSRSVVINATDGTTVPREIGPAVNLPTTAPAVLQPVNLQTNPGGNVPANVTKPVEQPQQKLISEANNKPSETQIASNKPVVDTQANQADKNPEEVRRPRVSGDAGKEAVKTPNQSEEKQASSSGVLVDVGSLLDYATAKSTPAYPSAARTMRASGVVRVDVVIDENGDVAEVKKANGHALLQAAAKDAIRRWKFRPVTQNGLPVRATGYVNFNFAL